MFMDTFMFPKKWLCRCAHPPAIATAFRVAVLFHFAPVGVG